MADTVLDLSAKSLSSADTNSFPERRRSEYSNPSPTLSTSALSTAGSNSDGNDSDAGSSPIKPVRGPVPKLNIDSQGSPSTSRDDGSDSPSSPSGGTHRPFKMYPMDTLSSVYPSSPHLSSPTQLTAAAAAAAAAGVGGSALGLSSMYETSPFPSFPITPLTSHLLQRKRRAENRSVEAAELLKKTKPVPEEKKDDAYWDRRRKNNEAAKRSRDSRRQKEEEIAMRAAFLEQENLKLRAQVAILKNETAKLHYMLYNRL